MDVLRRLALVLEEWNKMKTALHADMGNDQNSSFITVQIYRGLLIY